MNVVGPMRRSGSMPRCTHSGLHLIGGLVGGKLSESFLFSSFGGVNQGHAERRRGTNDTLNRDDGRLCCFH